MVTRTSCRLCSILLCLAVLLALGGCTGARHGKPMYVGRVTLMEMLGPPVKGQPDYYQKRLNNLASLATSQAVLSNSTQTLSSLGASSPEVLLSGVTVVPVKDTSIVAIEATLADPKEAKVTVDVIAAETIKEYNRIYAPKAGKTYERGLKVIDRAYVRPAR